MGCWDETDALTLAPIYPGEKVICLAFHEDVLTTLYGEAFTSLSFRHFAGSYEGAYDYYGGIEGRDKPDNHLYVFFKQKVWDFIINFRDPIWFEQQLTSMWEERQAMTVVLRKTNPSYEPFASSEVTKQMLGGLLKAFYVCGLFRRAIFAPQAFAGHQEFECSIKDKLNLCKLTRGVVLDLRKKEEEYD